MLNELIKKVKIVSKMPIKNLDAHARRNGEYKAWRKAVYARDGYRCKICGKKGYLNAHHILGFSKWKSKRYLVENGITLCRSCHTKFHKKYGTNMFPNIVELLKEGKLEL